MVHAQTWTINIYISTLSVGKVWSLPKSRRVNIFISGSKVPATNMDNCYIYVCPFCMGSMVPAKNGQLVFIFAPSAEGVGSLPNTWTVDINHMYITNLTRQLIHLVSPPLT